MTVEYVSALLEDLMQELDSVELEPSAVRSDWSEQRQKLDHIEQALEALTAAGDEVLAELEGDDLDQAKLALCVPAMRAAALLFAAGRKDRARAILKRTRDGSNDATSKQEFDRALSDMGSFARLNHARWLLRQGRSGEAKAEAQSLLDSEFAESAQRVLDAPEPIGSAPTLGTFNGFGLGVYGERDAWPDGSYVTTRFITALFVPILPLDAYRVTRYDDGYSFFGKVPLGRIATWWRRLLVASVALVAFGSWGYSYWTSPSRRLSRSIAALVRQEKSASDPVAREQLIQKHEELMDSFAESVAPTELEPASEAVVRLATAEVPEPMVPDNVDTALRVVRRYAAIPSEYRAGGSSTLMSKKIEGWVTALGDADDQKLGHSLRLLEVGSRVLAPGDATRLGDIRDRLELRLSDVIAKDWPLASVRICSKLAARPEAESCGARVDGLGQDMSRLVELEPELRKFVEKTRSKNPARASQLEERLERARTAYDEPKRKALLESEDENKLRDAHLANLHDQDIAVAIADIELGRGAPEKAKATLESLGIPGSLVWKAQHELALVLGELGEVQRAETLLERMLAQRLPDYEAATAEYSKAATALEKRLVAKAESGDVPDDIAQRFRAVPEGERQAVFDEWLSDSMSNDASLSELRAAVTRASDVVPTAIALGTLELRRATGATGDERGRFLGRAERAFLAIRSGGEGVPSFHLGLGQVYHRLGKSEEGERELGRLLEKDDPAVALAVARAYRGLGMESRTREICQKLYDTGAPEWKNQAATLMSLVASDRAERATWLRRADAKNEFVQISLIEIEGETLLEAGKLEEADAKYAEAFQRYSKDSKHSSSAANNAALALGNRYQCTGDRSHIDHAIRLLESARSLDAESTLVLMNTAPLLEQRAMLKILGAWLRLPVLKLSPSDADALIDGMLEGEHRERILEQLKSSPDVRRAIELWRQAEVLGPRRTDVYRGQLAWAIRFEDATTLRNLKARVDRASLDTLEASELRVAYVEGKRNEIYQRSLRGMLVRLERTAKELDPARDKPSLAAVRTLESGAHSTLALVDPDAIGHARKSLETFRQADAAWPAIGARASLDGDLMRVALLSAAKKAPQLFPNLDSGLRELSASMFLFRALERSAEPALSAVRAEPEWAEAVRLRKELAPIRSDPGDWLLGRIANDTELVDHGKRSVNELKRTSAGIERLLSPGPGNEARHAFLTAASK